MISREVAWRAFAGEYNSSTLEFKDEGERSPSYVITPLGAMVNRLLAVGVMTDNENIGTEAEPLWRARVSDPSGIFYLSAGQYQPEAAMAISEIDPPEFVAVVGKSRTYSPEEGTVYVSIRPESVKVVDEDIRDYWVLETARSTLNRISAMEDALEMEEPTAEELVNLDYSERLSEGIVRALEHYVGIDPDVYRAMVVDSLRYLLPDYEMDFEMPEEMGEEPEEIELEEEDFDQEEIVLQTIDDLDQGDGAPWDDIVEEVKASGISKTELEEVTNSLLDKGLVYEPVLGKMKRI